MAILTGSLVFSPFTKIAVFSFSTSCGSRASNARFERAFLGLLWNQRRSAMARLQFDNNTYIVRSIAILSVVVGVID